MVLGSLSDLGIDRQDTSRGLVVIDYDFEKVLLDGTVAYYATYQVGGRDEEGEYVIVLDGPAQGERVYL